MPAKKRQQPSHLIDWLIFAMIAVGLGLLIYPTFGNLIANVYQMRQVVTYDEKVKMFSKQEVKRRIKAAKKFNQALKSFPDRFKMTKAESDYYYHTLDVNGTGMIGTIVIPKIHVKDPVYHGTSEEVLQHAVGNVQGSSLPVGGVGNLSCTSGHRGLPSARLFTDLVQLKKGDIFYYNILGRIYAYRIIKRQTVLPGDVNVLQFKKTQDLSSLVTCTPYGINTHRLVLTGERIKDFKLPKQQSAKKGYHWALIKLVLLIMIIIVVTLGYLFYRSHRKKSKKGA